MPKHPSSKNQTDTTNASVRKEIPDSLQKTSKHKPTEKRRVVDKTLNAIAKAIENRTLPNKPYNATERVRKKAISNNSTSESKQELKKKSSSEALKAIESAIKHKTLPSEAYVAVRGQPRKKMEKKSFISSPPESKQTSPPLAPETKAPSSFFDKKEKMPITEDPYKKALIILLYDLDHLDIQNDNEVARWVDRVEKFLLPVFGEPDYFLNNFAEKKKWLVQLMPGLEQAHADELIVKLNSIQGELNIYLSVFAEALATAQHTPRQNQSFV